LLNLYFLGSGAIAVPVLAALSDAPGIRLVGMGTQMDRPAGRHRRLQPTPVGLWAHERGLHAEKPGSVNREDFLGHVRRIGPDLIFVAAFGQILGERLLALPRFGCINLHASLLPAYRGASPIQAAIRNGDAETGVSFMRMEKGLDTGPVYAQFRCPIGVDTCADGLERQLGELGARHVADVLRQIVAGELPPIPQDAALASHAGKISKADGDLDWTEPAVVLARKIRAYHPWPGVSFLRERVDGRAQHVKITAGSALAQPAGAPGEVLQADAHGWVVAAGEGALSIARVIPEGGREMSAAEYLRGHPLVAGSRLPVNLNSTHHAKVES
jgi:methionyl-tRNA formyltransferase